MTLPTGIKHIVVIMMENQNDSIITNGTCPYFASLAKTYAYASNYRGTSTYSLPNYLALTCAAMPLTTDVEPPSSYQLPNKSLADLITNWNHFAEDYPSPCYLGKSTKNSAGLVVYSAHHNPWSYYKNVVASQCNKIQDLTKFNPNSLPTYCMIQPNNEHSGHTGDSTAADSDKWASTFIPNIINSSQFAETLIILTWDNALPWPGVSPTIFISPYTQGVGTVNTAYNHYSTLHTIEELLGIGTLTNNDASASIMSDMFVQSTDSFTVTISSTSNPVVGSLMTLTATTSGGVSPFTYSWNGLPAGVSNVSGDTVSGTPTTAGTYNVNVVVTDSKGTKETSSLQVVVSSTIPPPPTGTRLPLDFLAYNQAQVTYLISQVKYLQAGDTFNLSSGNFGASVSISNLNSWAQQIKAVLPGAVFNGHTGGLANAQTLANGLSSDFTGIAIDEEPNEPGFDGSQSATLSQLQQFASIVRNKGFKAIGYMSGQGVNGDNAVAKWDYGAFGEVVDHVTVETQGAVAGGNGPTVVAYLANQFKSHNLSTSKLTCQATVGTLASGTTVTLQEVLNTYNASVSNSLGSFFLEFAGSTETDLTNVLKAIPSGGFPLVLAIVIVVIAIVIITVVMVLK